MKENKESTYKWLLNIQPAARRSFDRLLPGQKQSVFRHLRQLLIADEPYGLTFVEMLKESKFERIRKFRGVTTAYFLSWSQLKLAT